MRYGKAKPLMPVLAVALAGAAVAGCTNYKAVGSLAGRLTEAGAGWDGVARDFAIGCQRFAALGDGRDDCAAQEAAAAGLLAANGRLLDYFSALQQVAEDGNYSLSTEIEDLSTAVAAVPGARQSDVAAVGALGALLGDLFLGAKRERTVRRLINEGAPDALAVVRFLRTTTVRALRTNYDIERQRTDYVLASMIRSPLEKLGRDRRRWCETPPQPRRFGSDSSGYLMALELCRVKAASRLRDGAVNDYEASLAAAEKALIELQGAQTRLGAKETAQQLYSIAAELRTRARAVRAIFGQELTA